MDGTLTLCLGMHGPMSITAETVSPAGALPSKPTDRLSQLSYLSRLSNLGLAQTSKEFLIIA